MEKYTPMMRQYLDIKKDYEDALLFYRLGDFYELFFKDAIVASEELNLVLTARSSSGEKIPMCGVPHHAASSYIYRLTQKGHKIAIVEQLENPEDAEGIVKRGVVKIVTPGTIIDELVDNSESIYLAAITDYQYGYAVALVEMASGKVVVFNVDHDTETLIASLMSYNTKEVVLLEDFDFKVRRELSFHESLIVSTLETSESLKEYEYLIGHLKNNYHHAAVELLLTYLNNTQMKTLNHLREVEVLEDSGHLRIDYNSINNLELVESLRSGSFKNKL